MPSLEIKKVSCRFCSSSCPVQVHVMNSEVVKVERDPMGRGGQPFICQRAALGAVDFHNHPQRLNYPLKRSGVRGEGKWTTISWHQAIDEISEKLKNIRDKYGPEAVGMAAGVGLDHFAWAVFQRWCNLFGTPNSFFSTKNCWQPQVVAELAVYGSDTYPHLPQPGLTKCAVVFGGNPCESRPYQWKQLINAKKLGTKLIVIDPRRTHTAEMADLWLQVRPGSDGALAYSMMNVIIREELYDKQFVQKWCTGFDKVSDFVKAYSPEKIEIVTWIPREKIIQAARIYATSKPAVMQSAWGVTHSQLGIGRTLSVNLAKCILRSITGNLDVEGGEYLHARLPNNYAQNMHWDKLLDHPLRKRDTIGSDTFPIMSVKSYRLFSQTWKKVYGDSGYPLEVAVTPNPSPFFMWSGIVDGKPYPIKALIVTGANIMCSTTNTNGVYRALTSKNLDLLVSMDCFMNPHGVLADYVLPATDWMEKPHMNPFFIYSSVSEQAVKPKFERKSEYELWRDLGRLLGQAEYWPETPEEMYERFLEPTGLSFKELFCKVRVEGSKDIRHIVKSEKKYEKTGFATPSGKVELVPTLLKQLGYEVPVHCEEFLANPDENYPLILITGGRVMAFVHSTLRQLPKLRQRHPDPLVQIHPDTAQKYQISNGEWVGIETPLGKIKQKAEVTDRVDPRVVHIEHAWWFPEEQGEAPHLFGVWKSNAEVILPNNPEVCDYQGGPPMRAVVCRLTKL